MSETFTTPQNLRILGICSLLTLIVFADYYSSKGSGIAAWYAWGCLMEFCYVCGFGLFDDQIEKADDFWDGFEDNDEEDDEEDDEEEDDWDDGIRWWYSHHTPGTTHYFLDRFLRGRVFPRLWGWLNVW